MFLSSQGLVPRSMAPIPLPRQCHDVKGLAPMRLGHDIISWRQRLWRQEQGPFFEIFWPEIYLRESFEKKTKKQKRREYDPSNQTRMLSTSCWFAYNVGKQLVPACRRMHGIQREEISCTFVLLTLTMQKLTAHTSIMKVRLVSKSNFLLFDWTLVLDLLINFRNYFLFANYN
jgi:hypothetical protein